MRGAPNRSMIVTVAAGNSPVGNPLFGVEVVRSIRAIPDDRYQNPNSQAFQ
jgi:hypothetical protein